MFVCIVSFVVRRDRCFLSVPRFIVTFWPVWLYYIFLHNIIKGTIFRKKIFEHEYVF